MTHKLLLKLAIITIMPLGIASNAFALPPPSTSTVAISSATSEILNGAQTVDPNGPTVQGGITAVVNVMSLAIGVFSVIMIIYGGFKFVSSAGDSNGVASAKKTIIYALVGLTLAVLAQAIMRAVIGKVSSAG